VSWDNRDVLPAHGPAARAVPAISPGNRELSPPVPPCSWPKPRERNPGVMPAAGLKYQRLDGTRDDVTLTDTFATLFTFSGRPDVIWVSVRAFPAMFRFTDRLSREDSVIQVDAGQTRELHISRERVEARNCIAGSDAIVTVVGGWAERDEPHGIE